MDKHVATCSLEKKLSGPKCCLIVHWKQNVWYKVDYKVDPLLENIYSNKEGE